MGTEQMGVLELSAHWRTEAKRAIGVTEQLRLLQRADGAGPRLPQRPPRRRVASGLQVLRRGACLMATYPRSALVIIWPDAAYAALLTLDKRYIFEPCPIMRKHAPPGTPTADVIAYYTSRGAQYRILNPSQAQ